ncbi:MAG: hypothetical protein WA981_04750 [Glaciecola sp.]
MILTDKEKTKALVKPKAKAPHKLLGTGKGYFTSTLADGTKVHTVQVRHNYQVKTIGRFRCEDRARAEYLAEIKKIEESYNQVCNSTGMV